MKRLNLRRHAAFVLPALLVSVGTATAQVPSVSPRAHAMGGAGAYDALACGGEAVAANPAALAGDCDEYPIRAVFPPMLSVEGRGNGPGSTLWRLRGDLIDGIDADLDFDSFMDPTERAELLGGIGPDGLAHTESFALPLFVGTFGHRTAVSLTFSGHGRGNVSRDLAELLLNGYEPGRLDYSLGGTDQELALHWTLGLSRGFRLGDFGVGVTAKGVAGSLLTRWRAFEPEVSLDQEMVRSQLVGVFAGDNIASGSLFDFRAPDGWGWGVDVGVMRDIGPLRASFAVQNLVHGMSWSDELRAKTLRIEARPDDVATELETQILQPSTATLEQQITAEGFRESAGLARTFRLGLGHEGSIYSIGAGGAFVQGDGWLGRGWDQRLGVGGELRPLGFLAVRASGASDLEGGRELGAGLALDMSAVRLEGALSRVTDVSRDQDGWRASVGFTVLAR